MKRIVGRAIAYLVLIALGVIGAAPFVYLAILSCKRRIDILAQVPPSVSLPSAGASPVTS